MTTIREIAARAGVSVAAASRVLSYDPSLSLLIGEEVRKRVFEIAAAPEESYSSQPRGRNERRRMACRIGLFGSPPGRGERADQWRGAIHAGVQRECELRAIECVKLPDPADGPSSWPEELDGLIAVGHFEADEIARLPAHAGPMVFVGCSPDEQQYDSVVIDYVKAMDRLIAHWTGLGYRRFAYMGTGHSADEAEAPYDRLHAFRSGLARRGLAPLQLCLAQTSHEKEGQRLMADELRHLAGPTAFLIENGDLAAGASIAAKQAGLRVPEDVPIMVLDNRGLLLPQRQPFAAVKAPMAFMGETAVKLLAERLRTSRDFAQKTVLQAALTGV